MPSKFLKTENATLKYCQSSFPPHYLIPTSSVGIDSCMLIRLYTSQVYTGLRGHVNTLFVHVSVDVCMRVPTSGPLQSLHLSSYPLSSSSSSSPSLLPIQPVKLSSFLLPSGRVKPSQTKHGQAARHSPRTHAKIYNKCTNVHPHACPHEHAHMHASTRALGAGVRSCPTPHKQ